MIWYTCATLKVKSLKCLLRWWVTRSLIGLKEKTEPNGVLRVGGEEIDHMFWCCPVALSLWRSVFHLMEVKWVIFFLHDKLHEDVYWAQPPDFVLPPSHTMHAGSIKLYGRKPAPRAGFLSFLFSAFKWFWSTHCDSNHILWYFSTYGLAYSISRILMTVSNCPITFSLFWVSGYTCNHLHPL